MYSASDPTQSRVSWLGIALAGYHGSEEEGKGGPARARGIRHQFFLTAKRRIEMESREVS